VALILPKYTEFIADKLDPVIVTVEPPLVEPELGVTEVTRGRLFTAVGDISMLAVDDMSGLPSNGVPVTSTSQ
jgi:hypothetical protein